MKIIIEWIKNILFHFKKQDDVNSLVELYKIREQLREISNYLK